jgi:predicted ferric reductase
MRGTQGSGGGAPAGAVWFSLYLALCAAPLALALAGPRPPGRDFRTELAVALGFLALAVMCLQFVLTARFRRLKAPFGSDLVYAFHRDITVAVLAFVAAHPLLLWFTPQREKVLARLDILGQPAFPRFGLYAAFCLALLAAASFGRRRWRIPYESWRRSHAALAAATVVLATLHILTERHYLALPWKRSLWAGYTALWVGTVAWVRLGKPLRLLRRPYAVESVRAERGGAHTLAVTPVGHPGIRFSPGQFAWVTLFGSPFADTEHPFSFSGSAERPPRLEFTVKALGDFTRRVPDLAPGDRLYVDGPFGAISADRRPRALGYAFIVGGIGVTPAMSHLRTFADRGERRPLLLLCANNDWEAVTFREEIEELRARLDLRVVHVLARAPGDWTGEHGFVTEELLRRHLPAAQAGWEVFICGPPPMMDAVERALWRLGYPAGTYHSERFDLV